MLVSFLFLSNFLASISLFLCIHTASILLNFLFLFLRLFLLLISSGLIKRKGLFTGYLVCNLL